MANSASSRTSTSWMASPATRRACRSPTPMAIGVAGGLGMGRLSRGSGQDGAILLGAHEGPSVPGGFTVAGPGAVGPRWRRLVAGAQPLAIAVATPPPGGAAGRPLRAAPGAFEFVSAHRWRGAPGLCPGRGGPPPAPGRRRGRGPAQGWRLRGRRPRLPQRIGQLARS